MHCFPMLWNQFIRYFTRWTATWTAPKSGLFKIVDLLLGSVLFQSGLTFTCAPVSIPFNLSLSACVNVDIAASSLMAFVNSKLLIVSEITKGI
jgi:hypothetical protein